MSRPKFCRKKIQTSTGIIKLKNTSKYHNVSYFILFNKRKQQNGLKTFNLYDTYQITI